APPSAPAPGGHVHDIRARNGRGRPPPFLYPPPDGMPCESGLLRSGLGICVISGVIVARDML
ncbi:MAG: hypothetical protein ABF714_14115, partial [Novacetimonas hansenii]|uniref:hypothetical protein n=1 Tax=Novacetimonas hansenii TaxID=436 RepID=UPI0039EABA31